MQTDTTQSELEAKMNQIIAGEEGYSAEDPTQEEQEKYLRKYSLSALVFSVFYFWSMKDKTFFWLAVVTGVLFFPVLFVLPLYARRRAWNEHKWRSFSHFQAIQKKWDNAAIYGTIVFVLVFCFLAYYEVKLINNLVSSSGISSMNDVKKLQDDLRSTLEN